MLFNCLRHEQRHLLHPRTPWLFFQRDHPLRYDHLRLIADREENDFFDMKEEWGWLLDLPDVD